MRKYKTLTKKKRFELFKRDHFKCTYCGKTPPEVTLCIDHKIPVAKGGSNEDCNLTTSCIFCNEGKGVVPLDTQELQAPEYIHINLSVPSPINETRKLYGATWIDLIKLGIEHSRCLQGAANIEPVYDPMLEQELKLAVQSLLRVWNIAKGMQDPQEIIDENN